MRSRITFIIFAWLLLAPLSSSLVNGAPNATRAVFMMGSLHLISALGASSIVGWFKGKIKILVLILILILLSVQVLVFLNIYFNIYPKKDAIEWQYGMKQSMEFVRAHPEYNQVFVTDVRSQPYIFSLFYLKTQLPEFLNTVVYNRAEESKSFNTVSYFEGSIPIKEEEDKKVSFFFGGWDTVGSMPNKDVLYILSPSQYDGLFYKSEFSVKKLIRYPDGGDAFFLISAK